ncbi:protein rep [Helicobacter pylori]|uniref:protein rep n=1 Tax=Helicobacter pylori TaxID=210 RepID=UPI00165C7D6E|nr:protein rep [Helicobacter pylori]
MEILQEQTFKDNKIKNLAVIEKYQAFNKKKAIALKECGEWLYFNLKKHRLTQEQKLKLERMNTCKDRFCPFCNWRRQLKYSKLIYEFLNDLNAKRPLRFIFLTLTIKSCKLTELRETIKHLSKSFHNLTKTKRFTNSILGFLRVLEFTKKPKTDLMHPHYHVLLAVNPSYFSHSLDKYINQAEWRKMWQNSLKCDYEPQVNIKIIKPKNKLIAEQVTKENPIKTQSSTTTTPLPQENTPINDAFLAVISELCKYPMKDTDLSEFGDITQNNAKNKQKTKPPKYYASFQELTKQLKGVRSINAGGILKGILKGISKTDDDLIHINEDEEELLWEVLEKICYRFNFSKKNYFKSDLSPCVFYGLP